MEERLEQEKLNWGSVISSESLRYSEAEMILQNCPIGAKDSAFYIPTLSSHCIQAALGSGWAEWLSSA